MFSDNTENKKSDEEFNGEIVISIIWAKSSNGIFIGLEKIRFNTV